MNQNALYVETSLFLLSGSLAEHLCERLLQVMFEIWLLACARCFPPPTLWRTLREMCGGWRHHMETVQQWNRVCKVLTSKLLQLLYGPNFPPLKIGMWKMSFFQSTKKGLLLGFIYKDDFELSFNCMLRLMLCLSVYNGS